MTVQYTKKHQDGSIEVLTPHRYSTGKYRVEIEVSEADMIEHAKKGARVRMSGPRTPASIVPPDKLP